MRDVKRWHISSSNITKALRVKQNQLDRPKAVDSSWASGMSHYFKLSFKESSKRLRRRLWLRLLDTNSPQRNWRGVQCVRLCCLVHFSRNPVLAWCSVCVYLSYGFLDLVHRRGHAQHPSFTQQSNSWQMYTILWMMESC